MTESSVLKKSLWVMPTATTIAFGSFLATEQPLIPLELYQLPSSYSVDYPWEMRFANPYYTIVRAEEEVMRKAEIVQQFAARLINRSQDLNPEFAKSINDSFWDLV